VVFLSTKGRGLPDPDCEDTTIISDRGRGLQAAENDLEYANHVFCVQHLAEDVKARFGMEARRKLIDLVYARTKEQHNIGMDSLKKTHRNAYMYILSIDPALWATPFITGRRWGPTTSNVVEVIDALLQEDRFLVLYLSFGCYSQPLFGHAI